MAFRYIEVKNQIMESIKGIKAHTRIPSRPELCKQYLVTRTTVDRAISELIGEGFLYAKDGSGTYVAEISSGLNVSHEAENWGVIVPNVMLDTYPGILRGIEDIAQLYNANVVMCNSDNDYEKQYSYIKRLITTGVKGIIVVPAICDTPTRDMFQYIMDKNVPLVFCNRRINGIEAPLVTSNDFYGGYIGTKYLIKNGYKTIAYITRRLYKISMDRFQGYVAAMNESGLEIDENLIVFREKSDDGDTGYVGMQNILSKEVIPDAVFCFNDSVAMGAIRCIKENGYKVSEDIGVIGYDNTSICDVSRPKLTSISYQTKHIGNTAAEVLKKLIDGEKVSETGLYLYHPEIVERNSCKGFNYGNHDEV